MNRSKLFTSVLVASGMLAVAGCGEDDVNINITVGSTGTSDGGSTGGGSTTLSTCPTWTTALVQSNGTDVCEISATIDSNQTLSSDTIWALRGNVIVGNGNQELTTPADANNVVLTIEAGTHIVGRTADALIITRGSQINAQGTADAPIIFSSADDGYDGRGEWGGLVIQGFAPSNLCGTPCNIEGEGGVGFFGGTDPADDSGVLRYVVVAEAGYEVSPDNELNGISFMSVGSGTEVDYVQVHNNSDDGVEFFGGTVNVSHLVLTSNSDDSVDWDEGYQGNLQYGLVVHANDEADHGIEADNAGPSNDATPRSKPVLANFTFVGQTGVSDTGVRLKVGSGVYLYNSIVTGFDACLDIDDAATGAIIDTELLMIDTLFNCGASLVADDETATNEDFGADVLSSAVSSVTEVDPALDSNYAATDAAASLAAVADYSAADTADATFLDATDYVGAVEPGETAPWWDGWTIEGSL
ncbi:MAG: hypothetical protein SV583_10710 [Pseudomonadota bacterium]|nr:hypothetical protein [Pseudomonadota bacterium]